PGAIDGRCCLPPRAVFIAAPQIAERAAVDAPERPRGREGHATRSRLGELAQLVRAVAFGEKRMEPEAVGVRGEAVRPVGQAAVDAIERLGAAGARGFG